MQGIRSPPRSGRTSHQDSNNDATAADHEDTLASRNTIPSLAEGSNEDANSSSVRDNSATAEIGVPDGVADGSQDDSPPELDVELSRRIQEEVYDTEEVKAALRDLSRECFLAWREAAAMRHARRISNMDVDSKHGESSSHAAWMLTLRTDSLTCIPNNFARRIPPQVTFSCHSLSLHAL